MTPGELRFRLEAGVPVAVWGTGTSGAAALEWLASRGAVARGFDQKGDDSYPRRAAQYPVVVSSPGFGARHLWRESARVAGAIVISELDLASLWYRGQILAVTGTNGKTTLCQLLSDALARMNLSGPPCGNIGLPFCRWLGEYGDRSWAVVEVSSFQAEQSICWHPSAVIWTSFAEDHLEVHGDLRSYFSAKIRLLDQLIPEGLAWVGPAVAQWSKRLGVPLPAGCLTPPPRVVAAPDSGPFREPPFLGNYQLARSWFLQMGWPESVLREAARKGTLAPHRLEVVGTWEGVTYVDDSKATNFSAVEAALQRFAGRRLYWIGGGKDKGSDLHELVSLLAPRVMGAWTLGETGPHLARALEERGMAARCCSNLAEAVGAARARAGPGAVILLSPGFSSLDQFSGYRERGRTFEKAVLALNPGAPADLVEA